MAQLLDFPGRAEGLLRRGTEPPDNGDMEVRLGKLETAVLQMQQDVAVLRAESKHYATKADLHESTSKMVQWIVGTNIAAGAVAITVMTFVLNNATPKASQPAAQPSIIVLPALPAASR